jgi:hypothetical protein
MSKYCNRKDHNRPAISVGIYLYLWLILETFSALGLKYNFILSRVRYQSIHVVLSANLGNFSALGLKYNFILSRIRYQSIHVVLSIAKLINVFETSFYLN